MKSSDPDRSAGGFVGGRAASMEFTVRSVGILRTPYDDPADVPTQENLPKDAEAAVEVFPEFAEGLRDVEGFSHLILLCYFHRSEGYSLVARPLLDPTPRGVFAIRSPRRPNPIGMTVVRLKERRGATLIVTGADMVNGTPLLDIKPYIPDTDAHEADRTGWIGGKLRKGGSPGGDGIRAGHTSE